MKLAKRGNFGIVSAVVVLAALGAFYGWQYYSESLTPAPVAAPTMAKPKASPAAVAMQKPEALVNELLEVSGLNAMFKMLPEQIIGGMRASAAQQKTKPLVKPEEMEGIAREVFSTERFHKRASEDLKSRIPTPKLRSLVDKSSQPLAKRMTQLEVAQPNPAELAAFLNELVTKPMAGERVALLKRLDESSKSSEMGVEITFATLNAMMAGAVGEKSGQMQMLQTALAKQRNSIETNVRNNIAVTLAFLYRKASDADLASYAELLETADLKLFRDVVYESLITEIKAASKEFGGRVGALFKPTGPGSAPPSGIPVRDTGAPRVMRTSSRANLDARICLQRTSNIEIIQCAEEYR